VRGLRSRQPGPPRGFTKKIGAQGSRLLGARRLGPSGVPTPGSDRMRRGTYKGAVYGAVAGPPRLGKDRFSPDANSSGDETLVCSAGDFNIAASLPVAIRRDFVEDIHRTGHCRKEGIAPEYLPYYRNAPPIGGGALKVTSTTQAAPVRWAVRARCNSN
jgi:hypothetical protein